ncbi:GMC family oxidoreductase N-terminal domain-containing protein, partial [Vibrio vulnificus]|nr:GMC family oxidoreductase N-terminal domain-containing protein [Vibrio vulnificus]
GIKFIRSDGNIDQTYEAFISQGEVILSAGALGSPQILLLSGIGPENHLKKLGIPVVLHLKGVGEDMQDNPAIAFTSNKKMRDKTI